MKFSSFAPPSPIDENGVRRYSTLSPSKGPKATKWGTKPAKKAPGWRDEFLPTWMTAPDAPKLTAFDRAYLKWIRTLECRALHIPGHRCRGRMTAHHAGRKPGMSMLAPTETAIPLCWLAHLEGIEILGDVFKDWTRDRVRAWEDRQVAKVQLLAIPENRQQADEFELAGIGRVIGDGADGWSWLPGSWTEVPPSEIAL